MKTYISYITIGLCVAYLLLDGANRLESAEPRSSSIISGVTSGVTLGMTLKNFLKINKSAHYPQDSFGTGKVDDNLLQVSLEETLKHPLFSECLYEFRGGVLVHIYYKGSFTEEKLESTKRSFLSYTLNKYGRPSTFKISFDGMKNQPMLLWNFKKQVLVKATYTPFSLQDKPKRFGYISLSIGKANDLYKYSNFPVVTKEEAQVLLSQVRKDAGKYDLGRMSIDLTSSTQLQHPHHINPLDFSPTWSDHGNNLVFWSLRKIGKSTTPSKSNGSSLLPYSDESRREPQAISIFSKSGGLQAMVQLPEDAVTLYPLSFSKPRRSVVFELNSQIVIIDLQNSNIGKASQAGRVIRKMPSWNLDGSLIVMAGSHSPSDQQNKNYSYDQDIFVSSIDSKLTEVTNKKNWCVALFPGVDILPVFTLDGREIIFVHRDVSTTNQAQSLQTSSWSLYKVGALKNYTKNLPPKKIIDGLTFPSRLSWFPDGRRLLVAYPSRNPDVIDVLTGLREPLLLPVLRDPDLLNSQPLTLDNATLNPEGNQIAFDSLRWSGKPEDIAYRCIYTCRLDGSEVKRVTPADNSALEAFKYVQPGLTPVNAWGKLQPQANQGAFLSAEQQRAERELIESRNAQR